MSEWKALGSDSYQSIHQDRQRGSRERDLLVSYPVDGLIGITAPLLRRRQDPMSSKIFPPRKDSQERWHTDWTNARFSRLSTLPVFHNMTNIGLISHLIDAMCYLVDLPMVSFSVNTPGKSSPSLILILVSAFDHFTTSLVTKTIGSNSLYAISSPDLDFNQN